MVDTNKAVFQIGGEDVEILVDTGANVSAISEDMLDRLVSKWRSLVVPTKQEYVLKDVQGNNFSPYGLIDIPIKLDNEKFVVTCMVLKNLPVGMLLGMPFLSHYRARIVCEENNINGTRDSDISILDATKIKPASCKVYIEADQELPPLSLTAVACYLDNDAYVSLRDHLDSKSLRINDPYDDGSILSVRINPAQPVTENFLALCQEAVVLLKSDNKCVCHLINPTSQPLTIPAAAREDR